MPSKAFQANSVYELITISNDIFLFLCKPPSSHRHWVFGGARDKGSNSLPLTVFDFLINYSFIQPRISPLGDFKALP